ncbi:MAG TPA: hypothetical protein VHC21_02190 [Candidatus Saccharimonadales bacterium]|nr:hypothetical protein [Candidatus Saccharimonadales bacterium]
MSMHPGYPELVKTALASDLYWRIPAEELSLEPATVENSIAELQALRKQRDLSHDTEVAYQIGSVLHSAFDEGTIDPVPYGGRIPELHGRQIVRVVEDSRQVYDRWSFEHLARRFNRALYARDMKKIDPEYVRPTFEEDLASMYEAEPPSIPWAEALLKYERTQVALVRRSVLYMKRIKNGLLCGMYASTARLPELWDHTTMGLIPDSSVGTIYSKDPGGRIGYLGKIISADVIEAHGIVWRGPAGKPSVKEEKRRDKKSSEVPQSGLAKERPSTI